jgi:GxxExxY protein
MEIESIATNIVDAAVRVHRSLGPGLLESAYQECFAYELRKRGVIVESEISLPILYDGVQLDVGYRIDMVIDKRIIVENKSVEQRLPIHEAQLLTYMKLGGFQLGFLINWNVKLIKNGIKRFVLNLPEPSWRLLHKENI